MRSGWSVAARHITGKYGEISGCTLISTTKNSADSRKRQAANVVCLRRSNARTETARYSCEHNTASVKSFN